MHHEWQVDLKDSQDAVSSVDVGASAKARGQGETKPGKSNKMKNGETAHCSPPGLKGRRRSY